MIAHIMKVFGYEFVRNLKRKGFLFTTFGVPLIAYVLFFGYQVITDLSRRNQPINPAEEAAKLAQSDLFRGIKKAGYVDLSGKFASAGDLSSFFVRYEDEATAQADMGAGKIDVYYVIAADYLQTGNITLTMPKFSVNQTTSAPIKQLIYDNLAKGIDRDLFNRLIAPSNVKEINLQRDASGQKEADFGKDFAVVYIFAITLMMSVFTTNGYLMQTVIEEKETRLIEVLISTMRPTQLLAGKILALGLLGLLQIIVWLGAVVLLGRIAVGSNITALATLGNLSLPLGSVLIFIVYFVLGYLFFAAAYGIVGAISTTMQEGPQYAVIFTLPAVIPFYFLGIFITTPDATLPVILSLFPVTAPLSMVMRVSLTPVPIWQIALSISLLAMLDILMIWLAGRMFRVQTLLAGQVPKLRDLPRLLRG
jgi:ABC-2 type transport system permease protein